MLSGYLGFSLEDLEPGSGSSQWGTSLSVARNQG
jgi:hypothetical protein